MTDHPAGASDDDTRSSVKARLTLNRRRRSVENDEYGAFVRRILRAYSRRAGDGDVEALVLLVDLAGQIDTAMAEAVKGLMCSKEAGRSRIAENHRKRTHLARPARRGFLTQAPYVSLATWPDIRPFEIRPVQPGDHAQVLAFAPRLTEGVAAWRDPQAVRRVTRG